MRAIWSGSLGFGLINIPVKMYSGSRDRALKFRLLDKNDHSEISYKKVRRSDERPVEQKDIVKGFEYEKGEYVILTPEDFKAANAKKTSTIEILGFCDELEVDPKYFDKPYYLESDKKSSKAYALLHKALKESGKAGIARYVIKDKEHIGMVRPEGKLIEIIQLRFQDEVIEPEEIKAPESTEFSKKEMDMALSLIDSLTEKFNIKNFKDTYADELRKIIDEKAKGVKPKKKKGVTKVEATDATDLLEALRRSLDKEKVR
jgi:DNA end-binding protein Ku